MLRQRYEYYSYYNRVGIIIIIQMLQSRLSQELCHFTLSASKMQLKFHKKINFNGNVRVCRHPNVNVMALELKTLDHYQCWEFLFCFHKKIKYLFVK